MNLENLSNDELRKMLSEKNKEATQLHNQQMSIKILKHS